MTSTFFFLPRAPFNNYLSVSPSQLNASYFWRQLTMAQATTVQLALAAVTTFASLLSLNGSAFMLFCYAILPFDGHFRHILIINLAISGRQPLMYYLVLPGWRNFRLSSRPERWRFRPNHPGTQEKFESWPCVRFQWLCWPGYLSGNSMHRDLSLKLTVIGYRLCGIGNYSDHSICNHQKANETAFLGRKMAIRADSATHLFYLGFAFYHRCGALHAPEDAEIQFLIQDS